MQGDPESFRDLTVDAFVQRLTSAAPVPGGGSASAVTASLAAGLVAMVASLSEGRPRYAEHAEMLAVVRGRAEQLAERFLDLADEDASAYGAFSAALKLPRETLDETERRAEALRLAARHAAEVPLRCIEVCVELADAAEALAGRSNVNASSDLNVAALLGDAAARGAAANVLVNVPAAGDPDWADRTIERVDDLLRQVARLADETRSVVLSGRSRPPLEHIPSVEPREPAPTALG